MMGRMEKGILAVIAAALVVLLLLLGYQTSLKETRAGTYTISVLARSPSERFRKGMDQAALDNNVDVHLVSSYEQDAGVQATFLERELTNHADAIVMQPEDVDRMQAHLVNLNKHALIVTVGQSLSHNSVVGHIGVDDIALGERLAALTAERAGGLPCMLVAQSPAPPNILARMDGFNTMMRQRGISTELLYCSPDTFLESMRGRPAYAVVALDAGMLQAVCEGVREEDMVFGAGYVSGVRTYLESGRISGLVVYSEYDEGYLSMRAAAMAAKGDPVGDIELGLYVADAENMYTAPLRQILFPIG